MLIVILGFVLFNATDLAEAIHYIGAMFGLGNIPLRSGEFLYYIKSYGFILLLAVIGCTPLPKLTVEKLTGVAFKKAAKIIDILEIAFMVCLLLLVTAYLVDGSFNPFLYFRF